MKNADTKPAAAYMPYRTMGGALDHLHAIGIPHKIDRAVFPSYSWGVSNQLIAGFKFLGLIDADGIPTPTLTSLVDAKDRKPMLRQVLQRHYAELIALDLTKVSPSQFDEKLSEYGVGGATLRKAKTFFIKAAHDTGIPLSPLLTRKTRNKAIGPRRRKADMNGGKPLFDNNHTPPSGGTSKTISLRSGGELALSVSVNLFELIGKDRDFVFEIIDKIQTYEKSIKEEPQK